MYIKIGKKYLFGLFSPKYTLNKRRDKWNILSKNNSILENER